MQLSLQGLLSWREHSIFLLRFKCIFTATSLTQSVIVSGGYSLLTVPTRRTQGQVQLQVPPTEGLLSIFSLRFNATS